MTTADQTGGPVDATVDLSPWLPSDDLDRDRALRALLRAMNKENV